MAYLEMLPTLSPWRESLSFSNTFVCGVIGPRMYADIRKTYFGKSGTPKIPQISMNAGNTRISGLHDTTNSTSTNTGYRSTAPQYSSAASYDEDKSKILQLAAEIEELTVRLFKYENNGEKTDKPPSEGEEAKTLDEEKPPQESLEKNEDLSAKV
jgi:hypothetical protein